MKTLRAVLILLVACCSLQVSARAQQGKQGTPQPPAPTGLALEVTYYKNTRPTYQTVPNNSWYGRFRMIEGWKPAEDSQTIQAVNISTRMEGSAVRVIVFLHLGKKMFEKEQSVGSYLLQENERVTVSDMSNFGLEPFEIAVVRVTPKSAAPPAVNSSLRSIDVVDIQAVESTLPVFKVTLRNSSTKNVSALFVEILVDGKLRISGMPHNRSGEPLIQRGETYELQRQMPTDTRRSGAGFAPELSPNQTIVIKAAVFDDGTYEGDAASAAKFRSFSLGRRTQFKRLAALYQQAMQSTESDVGEALTALREQINALGVEADPLEVDKLATYFSGAIDGAAAKDAAEVVMFEVRKEAVREVEDFRLKLKQDPATDREALRFWLGHMRDRYQKFYNFVKGL
jgi:hypothetical protein